MPRVLTWLAAISALALGVLTVLVSLAVIGVQVFAFDGAPHSFFRFFGGLLVYGGLAAIVGGFVLRVLIAIDKDTNPPPGEPV